MHVYSTRTTVDGLKGHKKAEAYAPARMIGGDDGDRTHDLRLAKPALSQLSYVPS